MPELSDEQIIASVEKDGVPRVVEGDFNRLVGVLEGVIAKVTVLEDGRLGVEMTQEVVWDPQLSAPKKAGGVDSERRKVAELARVAVWVAADRKVNGDEHEGRIRQIETEASMKLYPHPWSRRDDHSLFGVKSVSLKKALRGDYEKLFPVPEKEEMRSLKWATGTALSGTLLAACNSVAPVATSVDTVPGMTAEPTQRPTQGPEKEPTIAVNEIENPAVELTYQAAVEKYEELVGKRFIGPGGLEYQVGLDLTLFSSDENNPQDNLIKMSSLAGDGSVDKKTEWLLGYGSARSFPDDVGTMEPAEVSALPTLMKFDKESGAIQIYILIQIETKDPARLEFVLATIEPNGEEGMNGLRYSGLNFVAEEGGSQGIFVLAKQNPSENVSLVPTAEPGQTGPAATEIPDTLLKEIFGGIGVREFDALPIAALGLLSAGDFLSFEAEVARAHGYGEVYLSSEHSLPGLEINKENIQAFMDFYLMVLARVNNEKIRNVIPGLENIQDMSDGEISAAIRAYIESQDRVLIDNMKLVTGVGSQVLEARLKTYDLPLSLSDGLGIELISNEDWQKAVADYKNEAPFIVDTNIVVPIHPDFYEGLAVGVALGVREVSGVLIPVLQIIHKDAKVGSVGFPVNGEVVDEENVAELNKMLQFTLYLMRLFVADPDPGLSPRPDYLFAYNVNDYGVGNVVAATGQIYEGLFKPTVSDAPPGLLTLSNRP